MAVIVTLTLLLLFPPLSLAAENWQADFSQTEAWQVVRNQQHQNPDAPCRGPDGEYTWNFSAQGAMFVADISVPCSTEAIWKQDDLFALENFVIETTLYISDPNMDRNLLIRWQDAEHFLLLHLFQDNVYIESHSGGDTTQWTKGKYAFQADTDNKFRIEYLTQSQTLRLFINGTFVLEYHAQPEDTWLVSGYPGVAASVGMGVNHSEVIFRDFQVSTWASPISQLPLLKQNDSRWGNLEYNHAFTWSPTPTIARWGCALTSAVMVLHSHGHTVLPDQTSPLTPKTLNAWLISQTDGYLGQGHLNWRAVSRLTALNESQSPVPALEFASVTPANPLTWLQESLHDSPIILQVPGHFFVAKAQTSQGISIHDPFYDREWLSDYDNTFQSARVFTPSHTNLSAVMVTSHVPLDVNFIDSDTGMEIPVTLEELVGIQDPVTGESQPTLYLWEASLEPDKRVMISVEQQQNPTSFTIYGYNHRGEVGQRSGLTQSQLTSTHTVQLAQTGSSLTPSITTTQPVSTLHESDLLTLLDSNAIRSPLIVQRYQKYLDMIQASTSLTQAESIRSWWQNLSLQFLQHGWIDAPTAELLNTNVQRVILTTFP